MALISNVALGLFCAVIASDMWLARKIRIALEFGRLKSDALEPFRWGGHPVGIALNLFRMRNIPATNEFSDPDHISIRKLYRIHQVLIALFCVCIAALLLMRIAA